MNNHVENNHIRNYLSKYNLEETKENFDMLKKSYTKKRIYI